MKPVFFICALIGCCTLFAQEAKRNASFVHLTPKDGLASPQVTRIYQDATGFIWFATINGLQRFDGKNFKTFYSRGDTSSLPSDDIRDIKQDKYGRYWIATNEKGLCIYDATRDHFTLRNENNVREFDQDGDNLIAVTFTSDGNTAMVTGYNGLYTFDVTNLSFKKRFYTGNSRLGNDRLSVIFQVKDDLFLIGSQSGFYLFDAVKGRIYDDTDAPVLRPLLRFSKKMATGTINRDHIGRYWFSLWKPGLYCYDPGLDSVAEVNLETRVQKNPFQLMALSIETAEDSNLYIGTAGMGIYTIDIATARIARLYTPDQSNANSILSGEILTIFTDRQKNLWISTTGGVSRLSPASPFQYPLWSKSRSDRYVVSALLQTKNGHIWVGTYTGDGLLEFDSNYNLLKKYNRFHGQTNFGENAIWQLRESSDGHILICRQNGFSIIDPRTGQQDDFTDIPALSTGATTSVIEDDQHRYWVSGWKPGLVGLDPSTRQAKLYRPPGLSYIYANDKGKLLMVVYENRYRLYTFDPSDSNFYREPWHFFNKQSDSLFMQGINDISGVLVDGNMRYIIARSGFYRIDNTTGFVEHFGRADGLPSNYISSLLKDRKGRIWLGTIQGLSVFDPDSKTFFSYGEAEGLNKLDFQQQSILMLQNGMIMAGNGVTAVAFDPDSLLSYSLPPAPVITGLRMGQNRVPADSSHGVYRVSYKASNIVIDFASLDIAGAGSMRYAYKLEGFDKEWQYADRNTTANYTNLDGGNYRFRVKATRNGIDWVESGNNLSFFITSPFYKQWWFMAFVALFILSILYAFYRIRIQRILEMQRLRNNISQDLHDDVGATMTSISILSEVALQKVKESHNGEANAMMEQIGNSSRLLLQNLDDIVWSINPQNDPVEKTVLRMRELAAEMLEPNHIRYELTVEGKLENVAIPMQDRRHLFLIYKEALHNIVKYAACSQTTVSLSIDSNHLFMKIKDNGRGFNTANYAPGNGLVNMQERAREMKARIEILSESGKGSSISLAYPLK